MARPKLRYEEADFWILSTAPIESLVSSMGRQISPRVLRPDSCPMPADRPRVAKLWVTSECSAQNLPAWLLELTSLTYLDVPSRYVPSPEFQAVARQLQELHIYGSADLSFGEFPDLTILQSSDELVLDHWGVPNLRSLTCKLPRRKYWCREIGLLRKLESLCLSHIGHGTLSELAGIAFHTLRIHHSRIETLAGIERQQQLGVFSAIAMPRLARLDELREITFSYCPKLEPVDFLTHLPKLERIEFSDVPGSVTSSWREDPRTR